jgi:hypothetical protein
MLAVYKSKPVSWAQNDPEAVVQKKKQTNKE